MQEGVFNFHGLLATVTEDGRFDLTVTDGADTDGRGLGFGVSMDPDQANQFLPALERWIGAVLRGSNARTEHR